MKQPKKHNKVVILPNGMTGSQFEDWQNLNNCFGLNPKNYRQSGKKDKAVREHQKKRKIGKSYL